MTERRDPDCGSRRFRFRSFLYAAHGVKLLLATQPNARIHAVATVGAAAAGVWLRISAGEWAALVAVMSTVWVAEALNTAVEFVVDLASPEHRKLAGWAKDAAAGAVLLASCGALGVGAIVFVPKLLSWLGR